MSLDLQAQPPSEASEAAPAERQGLTTQTHASILRFAARWLPALGVALVGLVLAPRMVDYARHSWEVLVFPWQLDFDEGVNLNASWLLSQGVNIYRPNPPGHFVSSMYPPLYFLLNAAAIKVWGLGLASGRLLALAGALGVGAALWAWVYVETRRHAAGVLAALLWFSLGPVYVWSTFYKQDMLALALGLAGGAMAARWFSRSPPYPLTKGVRGSKESSTLGDTPKPPAGRPLHPLGREVGKGGLGDTPKPPAGRPLHLLFWSILPLSLAFWTKQSALAPLAAVGLLLLARDWRLGVRWGLAAAAAIAVPFAALDLALKGGLRTHVLAFEHYGRSAARLAKNLDALWSAHAPLVLCGLGFVILVLLVQSPKSVGARHASSVQSPAGKDFGLWTLDFGLSSVYLLVAVPAALLSNSLPTANYNHLLEILAPLCLALGVAFGAALRGAERVPGTGVWAAGRVRFSMLAGRQRCLLPGGVLLLALLQAGMVYDKPGRAWYTPLGMPLEERAARMERMSEAVAGAPGAVLSEDNWLLLKNGKRVIYDDPAAMAALANAGEWDQSTLLQDVYRRKFSLVLLQYDLTTETYNPRWTNEALQAMQTNYRILFRDVLFAHAPAPPPERPEAKIDCKVRGGPLLEGYTFRSTTANRGDNLPFSLYWRRAEGDVDDNVKFFLKLVDRAGAPKWGADLPPGQAAGRPSPSAWASGQAVRDDLSIPIAPDLPFGGYRLMFGVYTVDKEGKIAPSGMACAGAFAPEPNGTSTLADLEVVDR